MADRITGYPDDRQVSTFDRAIGSLDGLTGVTKTAPTTKVTTVPIIGRAATYIVQTFRQRDEGEDAKSRDTIFLQYIADGETYRIVIPAEVADVIARQRDALGTKSRKRAAKRVAEQRKADGFVPFVKKGGRREVKSS